MNRLLPEPRRKGTRCTAVARGEPARNLVAFGRELLRERVG